MNIEVEATPLLPKTLEFLGSEERALIHAGGTRSSKTWSILQALIIYGLEHPGTTIDIYRAQQAVARRTIAEDLVEVLEVMGIYQPDAHHQTHAEYRLPTDSTIKIRGTDQSQKLRGAKRQILYLNEANEIPESAWKQLKIRTTDKVLLDYNPSFDTSQHWIGELDAETIRSTYRDNKFLTNIQVEAIEDLIPVYREQDGTIIKDVDLTYSGDGMLVKGDPVDWAVYGRAEYRRSPLLMVPHYQVDDTITINTPGAYGLDFGYTAPSALVQIKVTAHTKYKDLCEAEELLYESQLTTSDLISRLDDLGVRKDVPIYCDSAEPDRIEQLVRAGYDAKKARKDISAGLDALRSHRLRVTGQNLQQELSGYQRKNKDSDQPATSCADHLVDSMRYALLTSMVGEPVDNCLAPDEVRRRLNSISFI